MAERTQRIVILCGIGMAILANAIFGKWILAGLWAVSGLIWLFIALKISGGE